MDVIDNYCISSLLRTRAKKLFSIKSYEKSNEYWIFQLHRVVSSIYDDVIRKMMAPGKILLNILKLLLMVHINTESHDSN